MTSLRKWSTLSNLLEHHMCNLITEEYLTHYLTANGGGGGGGGFQIKSNTITAP